MSEELKNLVELPEDLRELLGNLPNDVADKCLADTHQYKLIVESLTEMLEGFGLDKYEMKPEIISGLIQRYSED